MFGFYILKFQNLNFTSWRSLGVFEFYTQTFQNLDFLLTKF